MFFPHPIICMRNFITKKSWKSKKLRPGKRTGLLAEVFYNVNYVNVNYSVKNSTVDRKYLLFLQDFF